MIMKYLYGYLIIINILSFIIYGIDKYRAKKRMMRVKELTLFNLTLLGGSLGCLLGMFIFKHKTKIKRFYIINIGMMIFYILLIYYFGVFVWN